MVECHECGERNPDWSRLCQTCGAVIEHLQRPRGRAGPTHDTLSGPPRWVWVCYYLASIYLMFTGTVLAITGGRAIAGAEGSEVIGCLAYAVLTVGAAYVLTGLGLVFHVEAARGIVNFIAGLLIIFGMLGLVASIFGAGFAGLGAVPAIIHNVLDICVGGFLIYLIGETETRMPNV